MASRDYCSSVAEELTNWSERLHDLAGEIDSLPTGDKQRLFSQVEGLHILVTELDQRLCEMMDSCSIAAPMSEVERTGGVRSYGKKSTIAPEKFDYEIGG